MKHPTPDRFERMVERMKRVIWKDCAPTLLKDPEPAFDVVMKEDVAKLLRRQHAAFVRQVKRMKALQEVWAKDGHSIGYIRACDDLLAYLMKK